MHRPIYLDYNGTTPHAPEVIEAMRPFWETHFGNPSSGHWYGHQPRQAVENARQQVADLLNCRAEEILFTSGGTESNNHAIIGTARALQTRGRHLITCAVEHPAVLEVCRFLETRNFQVTRLSVDNAGRVDPQAVSRAIRSDTILISIMHANNEVGTLQPIEEIAAIAKAHGVPMHTDAAQSIAKISTDVQALGVDLLSLAGHKLYAPKGVGALYVRRGTPLAKFCYGAGQEKGRRAGTENVLEIVGLGRACELAREGLADNTIHLQALRDRLHQNIIGHLDNVRLNGHGDQRLPNTLSLAFKEVAANNLLQAIAAEVAASAGAACHAETVEVSHVLRAMDIPLAWAQGTVRFSVGRMTTADEIDRAADIVVQAVRALRGKK
jgi:cysteine desulfurase